MERDFWAKANLWIRQRQFLGNPLFEQRFLVAITWEDADGFAFSYPVLRKTDVNVLREARETAAFQGGVWHPASLSKAAYEAMLNAVEPSLQTYFRQYYERLGPLES